MQKFFRGSAHLVAPYMYYVETEVKFQKSVFFWNNLMLTDVVPGARGNVSQSTNAAGRQARSSHHQIVAIE